MKSLFLLRDDVTFLNFGSFGACLKPVFEAYQAFQREMESEPVAFIIDKSPHYLKEARLLWVNILTAMQTMSYV
jgi:isopenicillin-N epimerase